MALELEAITSEEGAAAFHAIDAAATPVDHPGLVAEPLDDVVGMLSNPMPSFRCTFYLCRAGGETVGTAFLGLPQVDNTHTCHLHVTVALEARRRGHGLEAAGLLFEEGRLEKRRLAIWGTGAPPDGTSPGERMAERLGATAALVSLRRELRLRELHRGDLEERLVALLEGPSARYELRSWCGPCPDELVEQAALLLPRVMSDSPRGELDMEDETWDAARYREYEAMLAARRRTPIVTVALERTSGALAAWTDLNVPDSEHRVASQLGTVVEPEHRGHRLGLAIKTANVLALLGAYPDVETVQTYNAGANEHMIAVNESLGFRVAERSTAWQLAI